MADVARVGDIVTGTCDKHGNFTGVWITGSPDIIIDGQAAVRVGDVGLADCGHTFVAIEGAQHNECNGISLHCVGHIVLPEAGGVGVTITGSPKSHECFGAIAPAGVADSPPPAVEFVKPDSPPCSGGKADPRLKEIINNPGQYYNPEAESHGIKPNYPGTYEQPPEEITSTEIVKCDNGSQNTIVSVLAKCLGEATTGAWRESGQNGNPSNPNIIGMWKNIGITWHTSDQVPWCAGFANYVLKSSGHKFLKEAGARNMIARCAEYEGSVIPIAQMQPGDLVLWSVGHVNFCFTAENGKYTFVGGNQAPGRGANPPVRDPKNDGDVTISYKGGWTPNMGGISTVVRIKC